MPVRGDEVPAKKAAPAAKKAAATKETEAPKSVAPKVRPTAATKAAEVKPEVKEAQEPALESKEGATTKVTKYPLEEKVVKYLAAIRPDLPACINESVNSDVKTPDGKVTVCFMTFSPNGADDESVDDDFNVQAIKDILFDYHTVPDKAPTGKQLIVEVLKPETEGDPTMVCFQEA